MHAFMVTAALALGVQAKGDRSTIEVDSLLDLEIKVLDGNGESTREVSISRFERFTQEVLAVAEGRPSSVRVHCKYSTVTKSGILLPPQSAISGRTYTATRGEKGWDVRDANGAAAPPSGQALGGWNDVSRLLPDGKIENGAAWEVPTGEIAAMIFPLGLVEVNGRIGCLCTALSGGRATIALEGQITEGKGKDGSRIEMSFTGKLVYDTATGRPVLLSVHGGLTITRDIIEEYRRPNENTVEVIKVGEIAIKTRRLQVDFKFK